MSFKNHSSSDLLSKYMVDKSIRFTNAQQGLQEATLKHPECRMLGASDALQLCANLIQLIGGKKVLDIGVYTGASSLSAALAIPDDGKVFALDITDEYLAVGRPFLKEAGVEHKIDLHLGLATETLEKLLKEGHEGTFDFSFIDADKGNYDNYYELSLKLVRSGGIIAFDNTIWYGQVVQEENQTADTKSIRAINDKLKDDSRINLSLLLIGDGLTLCFKK